MYIPISTIVDVIPRVLAGGGNPPILSGVFLSENSLVPVGHVLSFNSAADVGAYFGQNSTEYDLASRVYFNGYDNSLLKPGALLIAPYSATSRAAFLQSGFLTGMTLAELQAIGSGAFTITVDGVAHTTTTINLSGATSFSNAASLIQTGINGVGSYVTVAWSSINNTFIITSATTGVTSNISYAVDETGSSLAASLKLTNTTGAILSQGSVADTPPSAIANLVSNNMAWCSVMTLFEPDQDDKLAFASVISASNNKFQYVCWDTDGQAIVNGSTSCTAYKINAAQYNNTVMISGSSADALSQGKTLAALSRDVATFVCGSVASIDFAQTNGRTTLAFRQLAGLLATVLNETDAANLLANGYNYYGAYANATNNWLFFYNGHISGIYKWVDSFYGQVYLNAQFQTALTNLLLNSSSLPYNNDGYSAIKLTLTDYINQAINFGTIRVGVTLSSLQKTVTTAEAGLDISDVLFRQGYYLQVLDPGTDARQQRKTPIINFWYMDGQSIQQIKMDSINIQ